MTMHVIMSSLQLVLSTSVTALELSKVGETEFVLQ